MYQFLVIPFSLLPLISVVYFYMYYRRRERALLFWGFAWMLYFVSMIFLLLNLTSDNAFFLQLRKLVDMGIVLLLLVGMYKYVHLPIPAYWYRFSIYLLLLSCICTVYQFELISFYIPLSIFQIVMASVMCYLLSKASLLGSIEIGIASLAFILWGYGSAVLSIVEIYIGRSYLVYSTELILFNISSICLLAVYIQSSSVSEKMKNQIYENVVNNLRELIFYYDLYPAKRFQYISPSVKDLTGYSQQAFYDNPKLLVDIVEAEYMDDMKDLLNGMIPAGNVYTIRIVPRDKDPFWAQMNVMVIRDHNGLPIAIECEMQDINEIQSSQLEQIQHKEERDHLLSYVSHELRTPLTSISGFTTAIQDGVLTDPDDIRDALEIIAVKTNTLKTLIDDLGQLSKMETNQFSFDFMILDVKELSQTLVEEYLPEIQQNYYQGIVRGLDTLPEDTYIVGDEERISQVVANLVSNAIKYSYPETSIGLLFAINEKENIFSVGVRDQGPGVSDDDSLHLFERFYRSKQTEVTRSGRGLGLTLSKEIIAAHKGDIGVYNNKGKGCTFTFSIPLYKET